MRKLRKTLAVLTIALTAAAVFSHRQHRRIKLCEGFLPKNNLKIPVGDIHALGLDSQTFNQVLDRVQAVYGPIVAAHGGTLVINRLWDDPTVNSDAEEDGDNWIINSYGGLARYKGIDYDGYALVACHEMGHHLGGFPRFNGNTDWAAVEGEADYFATLKCLRQVLGTTPDAKDQTAQAKCTAAFPKDKDGEARCEVGALAGVNVAGILADLDSQPVPTLATPDPSVVTQMYEDHPAAQCRLDTYFSAAQCTKPVTEDLSKNDPDPGACTEDKGYTAGVRPRCWYLPPTPPQSVAIASHVDAATVGSMQKSINALAAQYGEGQSF